MKIIGIAATIWMTMIACVSAQNNGYDPQSYTPVTNSPAQLAVKQAALDALRTEYTAGGYSASEILNAVSKGGVPNVYAVTNHFNVDGSWYLSLPTGGTFSASDYSDHREYLSEVLALAYLDHYQGLGYKQTVYDTLGWYFDNGYAAPHDYHETFNYQDTDATLCHQIVRIGHTLYSDIHADRLGDPDVEQVFQDMREYARAFINAAPQIRGANWALRMDECLNYLLFTNDPADMDEYEYHWKKSLSFNQWEEASDGIHADWSMKHHGDMNYWGMYGQSWTESAVLYAELFFDKPWAYATNEYDFVAESILEGSRWVLYRGVCEYSSAPKRATIKTSLTDNLAANLKDLVGRFLAAGSGQLSRETELSNLYADFFLPPWTGAGSAQTGDPEITGHRYFWETEYQVHRRPNFAIYARRCSQRARAPESRSESPLHLNFGTGYTPILRRGDEIRLSRLAWDYEHIPGTTVEQGKELSGGYAGSRTRGLNLFSGGVVDGPYGFGAFEMSMVEYNSDLSGSYTHENGAGALKATFFFDDGMVALGQQVSRIATIGAQNDILTTINNVRRLTDVTYSVDGSVPSTVSPGVALDQQFAVTNVAWFLHDGMGYVVWPSASPSTEVVLSLGNRPFNTYVMSDTEYKNALGNTIWNSGVLDMFRLWIDHGTNPSNDTYAYAVLPDCTLAELQDYATNTPVQIVSNTNGVQAVANTNAGLFYASFASAGTADFGSGKTIVADRPLMVMARLQGGQYGFSAANPIHRGLRQPYVTGSGATVGTIYGGPVAVSVSGFDTGSQVEFNLPSERGEEGATVVGTTDVSPMVLGTYADWEFDNTGTGGVDSGLSGTDWFAVTPETASPAWTIVQLGDDPASSLAVDPANSRMNLVGQNNGGATGTSKAVLPFGSEYGYGVVSADLGLDSGSTWTAAKFNLVNIAGGVTNVLIDFNIQRNGTNINNLITTGSTNISINGTWEDVFNHAEIAWSNGVADIAVTGLDSGDLHVNGCTFLNSMPPNALFIQAGSDGDTKQRVFALDSLTVQLPMGGYEAWIIGYGVMGSPDADPDHDYDGDGFDNESEYIAGTDPTLPGSFPRISGAVFNSVGDLFIVQWESVENRLYDIYHSDNLTGTFSLVGGDIAYPRNSHTSVVQEADACGFFRMEIKQSP